MKTKISEQTFKDACRGMMHLTAGRFEELFYVAPCICRLEGCPGWVCVGLDESLDIRLNLATQPH